jgi:hypothetical protein
MARMMRCDVVRLRFDPFSISENHVCLLLHTHNNTHTATQTGTQTEERRKHVYIVLGLRCREVLSWLKLKFYVTQLD